MRTLTEKPSGGWASETSSTVVPAGRSRMGLGAVAAARVIAGRRSDWGLTKRVQVMPACAVRGARCGRIPGAWPRCEQSPQTDADVVCWQRQAACRRCQGRSRLEHAGSPPHPACAGQRTGSQGLSWHWEPASGFRLRRAAYGALRAATGRKMRYGTTVTVWLIDA